MPKIKHILIAILFFLYLMPLRADTNMDLLKKAKIEANKAVKENKGSIGIKAKELFDEAAMKGNAQAAFTLFLYNCFGLYEDKFIFDFDYYMSHNQFWDTDTRREEIDSKIIPLFNKGLEYLQRAADLNYPDAKQFIQIRDVLIKQEDNSSIDKTDIRLFYTPMLQLYQARKGDSLAQYWISKHYEKWEDEKNYEYWILKSLQSPHPPLMAIADYAHYLLDKGENEKAFEVKKLYDKTDFSKDFTAGLGYGYYNLIEIVDDIYKGNIQDAIDNCGLYYKNNRDYNINSNNLNIDFLENCINYFAPSNRKKLFTTLYDVNKNPKDNSLYFNRAKNYEIWGDSINAFNNYKIAALNGYLKAIPKTLFYASDGYQLSEEEILTILPYLEIKNYDNRYFSLLAAFNNWKVYYILGKFFYDSGYKDYGLSRLFFEACARREESPDLIKGECARYLYKCYTFGRGVKENENKAEEWLSIANEFGDSQARKISLIIFQEE